MGLAARGNLGVVGYERLLRRGPGGAGYGEYGGEPATLPTSRGGWRKGACAGTILLLCAALPAQTPVPEPGSSDSVPSAETGSFPSVLKNEAHRYITDGGVILLAPLHWDGSSWTQAAIAVASVALLSTQDERIDAAVARKQSSGADSVSSAVTPLGSYAAIGVSVASLGAGLLFKNVELRDSGRDAIEAEIFAAGIITPLLKRTVGRLRPSQGSDADEYHPLSSDQSFPSGHSTEAFAVASVFAARSRGWVVPVIAYTLASGVALARINDRAHFASDVVAGAIIGTAVGHTVVRLHAPEGEKPISWNLVPVPARRGAGLGIRLETGGP
jgi:membrane-associated phospholipid phosphatase